MFILILIFIIVNDEEYRVGDMFLEMGLLSSVMKIFENESEGDEYIIVYIYLICFFIYGIFEMIFMF